MTVILKIFSESRKTMIEGNMAHFFPKSEKE